MLEEKIPSVLEEAKKKEVNRIITIATDQRSSEKVCNYVKSYSNIYGTWAFILTRLSQLNRL